MMLKRALIAAAVGTALAGPVQAGSVLFDVNGQGQGANTIGTDIFNINLFSWISGNLLIRNTTPELFADHPTVMYAQSSLSTVSGTSGSFSYSNAPPGTPAGNGSAISGQLTYQLRMNVVPAPNGAAIDFDPGLVAGSFFDIFYNPVAIRSDVTGCGYGSHQSATCGVFPGTLILSGNAVLNDTVTLSQSGTTVGGLDGFADSLGDVDNGVTTRSLSMGAMSINMNVTYQNTSFFLTNIISTTLDLEPDLQQTETGNSPFTQANPSDEVVGNELQRTATQLDETYGTDRINNLGLAGCPGTSDANCDVHLQSNPSTSVITSFAPEPGSLALLGLGLAMFGGIGRRRARSRVAVA